MVVVLDSDDVARVLEQAPTPFHAASREKRQALQWFQPHGVLLSSSSMRERRRAVNEAALDTEAPIHRLGAEFSAAIAQAAASLTSDVNTHMDASQFITGWWRLVRRLVLGEQARDDETITDQLWRLRAAGNWAFLALPHYRRRHQFTEKLYRYAENPDPASLLGAAAQVPVNGAVDPVGQVPHWLFAFDAAGIALLRTLALLATHPDHCAHALDEATELDRPQPRPYLRACVLDSLRLWPTTPTILRDTTEDTHWGDGKDRFTIPAGAALLIVTPAFHRDEELLAFAHDFTPDVWLDGRAQQYPQLVPFSGGPAVCPGRNLVLFVTSTLLAHLLDLLSFELRSKPRPSPDRPLPMTFNHFNLEFAVTARDSSATGTRT
ncbi:cytochrome P450 [Mycolicibacterium arseniciresistens]|uniref:Cytochrome P450 n=1 Tax=Mycolicibacterium arseniciresistens TaxID=3062257 RepID=A0ABT8UJM7_9MYCO|nr:cytochrome P450 [Mycolicibacterium arseniciresistens]MDO3637966.1 cytochrome P450 [Mycolicibacterium arseniciresistens]